MRARTTMSKRIYFDTETTGLYPRIGEGDEVITKAVQEWVEKQ